MDTRLLDKAEPGHLLPIVSRHFCLHHRHHEGWDEESETTSQLSMTENLKCKVFRIDTEYTFEWLVDDAYYYHYHYYHLQIINIFIVYFSNRIHVVSTIAACAIALFCYKSWCLEQERPISRSASLYFGRGWNFYRILWHAALHWCNTWWCGL